MISKAVETSGLFSAQPSGDHITIGIDTLPEIGTDASCVTTLYYTEDAAGSHSKRTRRYCLDEMHPSNVVMHPPKVLYQNERLSN